MTGARGSHKQMAATRHFRPWDLIDPHYTNEKTLLLMQQPDICLQVTSHMFRQMAATRQKIYEKPETSKWLHQTLRFRFSREPQFFSSPCVHHVRHGPWPTDCSSETYVYRLRHRFLSKITNFRATSVTAHPSQTYVHTTSPLLKSTIPKPK